MPGSKPERGSFHGYLGACQQRNPRACADLKVPNDASRRDLSDTMLRPESALRAPLACSEMFGERRSALGSVQ